MQLFIMIKLINCYLYSFFVFPFQMTILLQLGADRYTMHSSASECIYNMRKKFWSFLERKELKEERLRLLHQAETKCSIAHLHVHMHCTCIAHACAVQWLLLVLLSNQKLRLLGWGVCSSSLGWIERPQICHPWFLQFLHQRGKIVENTITKAHMPCILVDLTGRNKK